MLVNALMRAKAFGTYQELSKCLYEWGKNSSCISMAELIVSVRFDLSL